MAKPQLPIETEDVGNSRHLGAGVAQPAERHVPNVNVVSSSLITRYQV
jgi:hypothetical protein